MAFDIPISDLPGSTGQFFATFARAEFALKRAGYLTCNPGDDGAKPDWNRAASELGERFFLRMRDAQQAQVFFDAPPQRQVVRTNGSLSWDDCEIPSNTLDLLNAVKRVRNNLFHGGKLPGVPGNEPSRNERLLTAGLFVISQVVLADAALNIAFRSD
ncbi:MAG: hypothetical protein AB7T59_18725 [Hyphomonadaceae bacterium]